MKDLFIGFKPLLPIDRQNAEGNWHKKSIKAFCPPPSAFLGELLRENEVSLFASCSKSIELEWLASLQ